MIKGQLYTTDANGNVVNAAVTSSFIRESWQERTAAMVIAPALIVLQLILAIHFLGTVRSFQRGVVSPAAAANAGKARGASGGGGRAAGINLSGRHAGRAQAI